MKTRFPFLVRPTFVFIGLFVGIALSADIAFSKWIIMKSELSNEGKLNRLLTSNAPDEIPVFGSSKARSAFIPDSLGENVFNYGMEKCGFDVINFLLSIELEKEKSSPIYIEFNHRSFISDPTHTVNASTYVPNLKHERVLHFLQRNESMELRYQIPGLRYFGSYFYYLRYFVKEKSGTNKIVSKGGNFSKFELSERVFATLVENRLKLIQQRQELEFALKNKEAVISSGGRKKLESLHSYLQFTYSKALVRAFKELAAKHPNRPIYLVQTPRHWSETEGIENIEEMNSFYEQLDQELNNVHIIDLSSLPVPDDGFKNTSHLNLKGAQLFSSALRKKLHRP